MVPFLQLQGVADEVVASDGRPQHPLSTRLMSLPHLMGLQRPDQIPRKAYLKADPERVRRMRERFASERRPIVALAWQGSRQYAADAQRSMPLRELLPVLRGWNARFVSVQRGDGVEQLDELPADVALDRLRPDDDAAGAFWDTAALLTVCDLVVSVDSAVAHLAGGLGVPTQLLLPHVSDWRWGTSEQPLAWYEDFSQLRQARPGDWRSAIAQLIPPQGAFH
jgi:hypothetical protein